jgi:predicted phosphodiesterase
MLKAAPDWFIHLGDMTEHGESAGQWDDFFGIEAPLLATAPSITTIGNHQRDSANYYNAFHLPGNEHWYSFSYGNARFICLEGDAYPAHATLYPLEEELAANTSPWLIVFQHYPVFTSAAEDGTETFMRNTLVPLFERYGVDVFLSGHKHNYERVVVNGITYIVSGGGGGRLTAFGKPEPGSQKVAPAQHSVLFEVDGDHLTGMAIDIKGDVIDRFELMSDGTTGR